ncbi:hypothetical protein M1271_00285 [Patescibacteria group bacterium]|nr:hypothetical protein [Patescibacteria group bacterium]
MKKIFFLSLSLAFLFATAKPISAFDRNQYVYGSRLGIQYYFDFTGGNPGVLQNLNQSGNSQNTNISTVIMQSGPTHVGTTNNSNLPGYQEIQKEIKQIDQLKQQLSSGSPK